MARRVWAAGLAAALLAAGLSGWAWLRPRPPAPPPVDLSAADPAVAAADGRARDALARAPSSPDAWGHLGMVLEANGFPEAALPCFVEAERLGPAEPRWPYFQALSGAAPDPARALDKLRRCVELCDAETTAPRLRWAEALTGQGRWDEAGEQFQRVLGRDPANPRAHLGLARLALQRGDPSDALSHLQAAAASPFAKKAAHVLLAEARSRLGDEQAADREQHLAALLPDDPDWPDPFQEEVAELRVGEKAQFQQADRLLQMHRASEAVALLRETLQEYPQSARCWELLGWASIQQGAPGEAERALREALRLAPDSANAHVYLGIALAGQGKQREAVPSFRRALELKPDSVAAYYNLGMALAGAGDRAGAVEALRQAVRCKPNHAGARVSLARVLAEDGRKAEAAEQLRQALTLDPDDESARRLLATLEGRGGPP